jgi:hypothetical protein
MSLIQSGVWPRDATACWCCFKLLFGVDTPEWRVTDLRKSLLCGLPFPFTAPFMPPNRGETSDCETLFGDDATKRALTPQNAVKSPSGDLTTLGEIIGTDTFGFRGCSWGGWPWGGGGTGGGWTPRALPGGSGGPTWLFPDIDSLEPKIK